VNDMPTKRKLINKRAYDEMILIKDFLKMNNRNYRVILDLDAKDKERFIVIDNKDDSICAVGYNYTELIKNLTIHMSETR